MLRLAPPPDSPDRVRFPAAFTWTCSFIAWLPPGPRRASAQWRIGARRGLDSLLTGDTRRQALALERTGCLQLAPAFTAPLSPEDIALLRRMSPTWDDRLTPGGRCVEIVTEGTLERPLVPLWASLAAASGLARSLEGVVLDVGWPRVVPDALLAAAMFDPPPFALVEHVLVLSSVGDRGMGRITTLGLHRLGLPELAVERIPSFALRGFASVLNGVAWQVLDAALATAPHGPSRVVEIDAEPIVRRAHVAAARGGDEPEVELSLGDAEPMPVRLSLAHDVAGAPWLALGPPAAWRAGRNSWARRVLQGLHLPWAAPPAPQCGHAPASGHRT